MSGTMFPPDLVFGLLDTSAQIAEPRLAAKARSLTLAWTRFKYFGVILEDTRIDAILARAIERGFRFCLIQAYGHLLEEVWVPDGGEAVDLPTALLRWLRDAELLVAGRWIGGGDRGYGLDRGCLLVDLERYAALGRPPFGEPGGPAVAMRRAEPRAAEGAAAAPLLVPASGSERRTPALPGWRLVQTSLEAGLPVTGFPASLAGWLVHLRPEDPACAAAFARLLDGGIGAFDGEADGEAGPWPFGRNERRFLANIRTLTHNLRRGVFVWNLESYADVEQPPPGFEAPVTALYSVGAGLKPNRILHTHGLGQGTRVVFFDYSAQELEFRRILLAAWDGEDYPSFLRHLFERLPASEAYYCLWDGMTPETVRWEAIEERWRQELERWGGAATLAGHWRRYRPLAHELVHCNLLDDPAALLRRIEDGPGAVIWWSNAFFSVYSNWFYTTEERRRLYRRWIEALATRAPRLYLYGSDSNNISVNWVQAAEYWQWYREHGGDELEPGKRHRLELRF